MQAGVCEVLITAGGSEREGQTVPDYHLITACHCFSPAPQKPAPVRSNTRVIERKGKS